ncbi:F-box/WD repeat-containing protein 4-like [Saccostrea cucullata]|uniref:F-box/WD repeat-containing protein 4-like n=1 Tax=Saccostrea cuccullata TaxID=36930 RepID=UPI002ED43703
MIGTANESDEKELNKRIINFCELPDDVLFSIFRHLDIKSLSILCRVCCRLKDLLRSDHAWMIFSQHFNVIHIEEDVLPLKEKFRISHNREKGAYQESLLANFSKRQMPWMQYHNGNLWVSSKNEIQSFSPGRGKQSRVNKKNNPYKLQRDVTKFVNKEGRIVSGCLDGSIHIWEEGGTHTVVEKAHPIDTQAVDCHNNILVSGSRDATLKVFELQLDNYSGIIGVEEKCCFPVGDRVWSLTLSQCGSFCACGTAFCEGDAPISLVDLNKKCAVGQLGTQHKIGAGVLDLHYENENTLLSCGYDTFVHMWDLRINTSVCSWEQRFDSAYYCLKSDGHMNIFAGASRHGLVDLWDKRQTKKPVQTFYIGRQNSPVYSLAFDSKRLYAALDLQVKTLDFSCYQ